MATPHETRQEQQDRWGAQHAFQALQEQGLPARQPARRRHTRRRWMTVGALVLLGVAAVILR